MLSLHRFLGLVLWFVTESTRKRSNHLIDTHQSATKNKRVCVCVCVCEYVKYADLTSNVQLWRAIKTCLEISITCYHISLFWILMAQKSALFPFPRRLDMMYSILFLFHFHCDVCLLYTFPFYQHSPSSLCVLPPSPFFVADLLLPLLLFAKSMQDIFHCARMPLFQSNELCDWLYQSFECESFDVSLTASLFTFRTFSTVFPYRLCYLRTFCS